MKANKFLCACSILLLIVFAFVQPTSAQQTFKEQSSSGQRFVYFRYVYGETSDHVTVQLPGADHFPVKESSDYEAFAKIFPPHYALEKVEKEGKELVLRELVRGSEPSQATAALAKYFGAKMVNASDKHSSTSYAGPWEITYYAQSDHYVAEMDVFDDDVQAYLTEYVEKDGRYLYVRTREWRGNLMQRYYVFIRKEKPVVVSMMWVHPGECGSFTKARIHPDLWGKFAKYVDDLPPGLRKYFPATVQKKQATVKPVRKQ
jgi:hypothetical protein